MWGSVLLRDHVHSYLHPIQQVCGGGWPLGLLDGEVIAFKLWALVFNEAISASMTGPGVRKGLKAHHTFRWIRRQSLPVSGASEWQLWPS